MRKFLAIVLLGLLLLLPAQAALAIIPAEFRNKDEVKIIKDMHGFDLSGAELVKADLRGVDLSEANMIGAVINTSQLQEANLSGADLEDVVAFASIFDNSDLRKSNFTNALLMQSTFEDSQIAGADFTNAILDLKQQRILCEKADGINPISGVNTFESLRCK